MREDIGDLWTYPAQYRVVTTNGIVSERTGCLIMGAGVALEAKKRFPGLPEKLGAWVVEYGNRAFICKPEGLLTFPTKHHWHDPSDVKLIRLSALQSLAIADKYDLRSIAMTRPGCGNGGLTWDFVKPYVEDVLDDRFVVLTQKEQS